MPVLTKYEAVEVNEPQRPQIRLRSGSSSEKNNVYHNNEAPGRGHVEDGVDGHDDVWEGDIRTADLLLGDTSAEESVPHRRHRHRHRALFFQLFGVRFRFSLPNFVSTAVESLLLPIVTGSIILLKRECMSIVDRQ